MIYRIQLSLQSLLFVQHIRRLSHYTCDMPVGVTDLGRCY